MRLPVALHARRTERTVVMLRALVAVLATLHVVLMRAGFADAGVLGWAVGAVVLLWVNVIAALPLARASSELSDRSIMAWALGGAVVDALALITLARVTIGIDPTASIIWTFVLWVPFSIALRFEPPAVFVSSVLMAALVPVAVLMSPGSLDEVPFAWTSAGVPMLLVIVAGMAVGFAMIGQRRAGVQLHRELDVKRDQADRLREADDVKNTFLSAVSHELRTPLTSLLGFSVTLLDRPDLSQEERERMLLTIIAEAEHLEDILANLLDLDRLTRGKATLVTAQIDPAELVETAVSHVQRRGTRSITTSLERGLSVSLDPAKVERIVENLVCNAVKYTPAEGQITVSLRGVANGVVISVDDQGPGIDRELSELIFEPFRRATETSIPGSGIGLSLVDQFSRMHGGRAWVEEADGGGCRFLVYLPSQETSGAPAASARVTHDDVPAVRAGGPAGIDGATRPGDAAAHAGSPG